MDGLMSTVMTRLLVQSIVIISSVSILTGCPSREGTVPVIDAAEIISDPLPIADSNRVNIDEPFLSRSSEENADSLSQPLTLSSFTAPASGDDLNQLFKADNNEAEQIVNADSGIVVALNTVTDAAGESEITLVVKEDTVYKIDHAENKITFLHHFTNKVCEIIPLEIVEESLSQGGSELSYTIKHGDSVFVRTEENVGDVDVCSLGSEKARFYELPLNFQFDGQDEDDSVTNELELVSEALARAQLVFGWVDDANSQKRLDYGYLGYALAEQQLNFYTQDRDLQWSQERELETFPVVKIDEIHHSPEYIFKLTELERQQYMLQLGLDIFVFDSGSELFSKAFNETDSILTDRSFRMAPGVVTNFEQATSIVQPVTAFFDSDDLLIIDDYKIFNYKYTASLAADAFEGFVVNPRNQYFSDATEYQAIRPFSQFDFKSCASNAEPDACQAAHDLLADSWQFITECESSLGCALDATVADLCETAAEKSVTQSDETLCHPSNYRHLSELNDVGNDLEFRGLMQYGLANYINDLDYILHDDSLFITARMSEKEIFLRYNYLAELSEPKPNREQVLFGDRVSSYGLDAYIQDGNLFMTLLSPINERNKECYKNYQQVSCNLTNTVDKGNDKTCTGFDVNAGSCVDSFFEFESHALFCSELEINTGVCSDNELFPSNLLAKQGLNKDKDAKWLKLFDNRVEGTVSSSMYLLSGEQQNTFDEGVLWQPSLSEVDVSTGDEKGESLGQLEGAVESVVGGWVIRTGDSEQSDILAWFDVISTDTQQEGGTSASNLQSVVSKYFHADTFHLENGVSSEVDGLIHAGDLDLTRVDTQP